jgi:hypothetical protein
MLRIYNTLTRQKEEFQTLEPGKVRMYVCGVTVYSDAHVGHAMSALVFDIIRRYLIYRGYEVRFVMNFTDVDDKIIARANQMGEDPYRLAQRYIDGYTRNLKALNILPATANPRVPRKQWTKSSKWYRASSKKVTPMPPATVTSIPRYPLFGIRKTLWPPTRRNASRRAYRDWRTKRAPHGLCPLESSQAR